MKLRQASAAALLAGLLALGCSGGGNGPTSSSGFQIVIIAALTNTAQAPTIFEAQLLVDGVEVEDPGMVPTPVATILFTPTGFVSTGPHTFALQIVTQTTSPNSYTVPTPVIRVFDVAGTLLKTIQLGSQTASLATGGTITYSFSL
jgi:hypothetical protein